jgi:ferrous iron transport protein A
MPALDFSAAPTPQVAEAPLADARVPLSQLRPGDRAIVSGLRLPEAAHGHGRQLVLRLLEIGFVEGEPVRVVAVGPGGREPLAVRIGGTMFALRRHEAEHVLVQREDSGA